MHMVAPRTGADEITVAEDQLEYRPLVTALYKNPDGVPILLTRWRFTEEERRMLAAGEDLYLGVLTFGQPLQPLMPGVGPEGWMVPAEDGGRCSPASNRAEERCGHELDGPAGFHRCPHSPDGFHSAPSPDEPCAWCSAGSPPVQQGEVGG